jgi:hypothetical protein
MMKMAPPMALVRSGAQGNEFELHSVNQNFDCADGSHQGSHNDDRLELLQLMVTVEPLHKSDQHLY